MGDSGTLGGPVATGKAVRITDTCTSTRHWLGFWRAFAPHALDWHVKVFGLTRDPSSNGKVVSMKGRKCPSYTLHIYELSVWLSSYFSSIEVVVWAVVEWEICLQPTQYFKIQLSFCVHMGWRTCHEHWWYKNFQKNYNSLAQIIFF